jgi:beta-lactamase regulating signal transducer with metallopeptidase domain
MHFGAKYLTNRIANFDGITAMQRMILAVLVCPALSYFLFMTVLLMSMGALFYVSSLANLSSTLTVSMINLILPLILAIYALVKWINFQASRLAIPRYGAVVHGLVVALALTGTFVHLALRLERYRRYIHEHRNNTIEQSEAPLSEPLPIGGLSHECIAEQRC